MCCRLREQRHTGITDGHISVIYRCAYPGCGARISESQRGRCDKHPRSFTRVRKLHSKQYGSASWKRARAAFIQVYPLCLICFLEGVITPVDEVDHIIPLDDNSDLEHLTHPSGLAGLCKSHHAMARANVFSLLSARCTRGARSSGDSPARASVPEFTSVGVMMKTTCDGCSI